MKKRGVKDEFLDRFNYENYGGTPILGVNAPVIIGHGISNAKAFKI
jgi:phosphate acyltransferase